MCRKFSALFVLLALAFAAHATTKVELLETFPPSGSDIVVPPGESVYLRIAYDTDTPVMGERIAIDAPHAGERWWRGVMAKESVAR